MTHQNVLAPELSEKLSNRNFNAIPLKKSCTSVRDYCGPDQYSTRQITNSYTIVNAVIMRINEIPHDIVRKLFIYVFGECIADLYLQLPENIHQHLSFIGDTQTMIESHIYNSIRPTLIIRLCENNTGMSFSGKVHRLIMATTNNDLSQYIHPTAKEVASITETAKYQQIFTSLPGKSRKDRWNGLRHSTVRKLEVKSRHNGNQSFIWNSKQFLNATRTWHENNLQFSFIIGNTYYVRQENGLLANIVYQIIGIEVEKANGQLVARAIGGDVNQVYFCDDIHLDLYLKRLFPINVQNNIKSYIDNELKGSIQMVFDRFKSRICGIYNGQLVSRQFITVSFKTCPSRYYTGVTCYYDDEICDNSVKNDSIYEALRLTQAFKIHGYLPMWNLPKDELYKIIMNFQKRVIDSGNEIVEESIEGLFKLGSGEKMFYFQYSLASAADVAANAAVVAADAAVAAAAAAGKVVAFI